jgi:hypothetical protein
VPEVHGNDRQRQQQIDPDEHRERRPDAQQAGEGAGHPVEDQEAAASSAGDSIHRS